MVATSSAESRKEGRACPILTARSLPSTSFETTKQSPSSVRPTSKTGTMFGMVQSGKDAGFVQIGFHILGVSDAFRVRHLDGDRAVEVVIVSKIDPSEPTLTQTADDPVTPDLRGIAVRGIARTLDWRLQTFGMSQALRLIRGSHPNPQRAVANLRFQDRFFVSSIARSLTSTDLIHGSIAEPLSHPEPGWKSGQVVFISRSGRLCHQTPGTSRYRTRWAYSL